MGALALALALALGLADGVSDDSSYPLPSLIRLVPAFIFYEIVATAELRLRTPSAHQELRWWHGIGTAEAAQWWFQPRGRGEHGGGVASRWLRVGNNARRARCQQHR